MKKKFLVFASAALLFVACNNNSSENTGTTEEAPTEEAAPAEDANVAVVTLNAGDDMKFDLTEIKVKEGQTVKLTLHHTGQAPKVAMGHNFVLLQAGASLEKYATEAINAKDDDYFPKSLAADVIAHTPATIGGGETTEVEFPAPAKGTYDFLCSFPGHSGTMKGKFIVE